MLSFFRSNPKDIPKTEPGESMLAFLLLAQPEFHTAAAVERLRTARFAANMSATTPSEDGTVAFYIGDEVVGICNMGVPYPENLETIYSASWMFPNAAAALGHHAGHVVISLTNGSAQPAQRMGLLTRIAAALAQEPGVVGIYMPDAMMVHRPDVFTQMSDQTGDAFPLYLWLNMAVWKNPDNSYSLATTGMRKLGRYEIEIVNVMVQPAGLREFIYGIAHKAITENPAINDGMEIGRFGAKVLRGYLKTISHGKTRNSLSHEYLIMH